MNERGSLFYTLRLVVQSWFSVNPGCKFTHSFRLCISIRHLVKSREKKKNGHQSRQDLPKIFSS